MKNTLAVAVLFAVLLLPSPAARGGEKEYGQAMADLNAKLAEKNGDARAAAIRNLGEQTFEKVDSSTANIILKVLVSELNTNKEEQVSNAVLDACIEVIKRIKSDKAIKTLAGAVLKKELPWRVRFYLIRGIAPLPGDDVPIVLSKLAEDKALQLQIAAIDALVDRADKAALPLMMKLLKESFLWEVRLSALNGVKKMGDETLAGDLIEVMRKARADEGRMINEIGDILKQWLGGDGGHDPDTWAAILQAKKEGTKPDGSKTGVEIIPTNFFGLKSKSTRIIYIVDISGSMLEPASEPPQRPDQQPPAVETGKEGKPDPIAEKAKAAKAEYDKRQVAIRIDALRKELINSIYNLDPRVNFNIIYYADSPRRWQDNLVPATWQAKLEAMEFADKLKAYGATNIFDSLEMALQFVQQKGRPDLVKYDPASNYATGLAGVDTIYLLTDGSPNRGRIVDKTGIVTEMKKVNLLRKVIINTIAIGDPNPSSPAGAVDPTFLQQLASENNGSFVHVHR